MPTRSPQGASLTRIGRRRRSPDLVLLYLHGGQEGHGTKGVPPWWPPVLLMYLVAHRLRRARPHAVRYVLRNATRHWNGGDPPVRDARWALSLVRRRHPDVPIVLVGHSMGGRVAARLIQADPAAVVGLAPWLGEEAVPDHLTASRVVLLHGDADRTIPVADTRHFAAVAGRRFPGRVRCSEIAGGTHSLLRHGARWTQYTRSALIWAQGASSERASQDNRG